MKNFRAISILARKHRNPPSEIDNDDITTTRLAINIDKQLARKNDDSLRILESFYAESIPKLGDATRVFTGPMLMNQMDNDLDSGKTKSILDAPIPFPRPASTTDDPCFERNAYTIL